MSELNVKLLRSRIGCNPKQRKILDALGLRHRETIKVFKDSAAIRGMLKKVEHLVEVVSV